VADAVHNALGLTGALDQVGHVGLLLEDRRFGTFRESGLAGGIAVTSILLAAQAKPATTPATATQPPKAVAAQPPAPKPAADGLVGIYLESVARQINLSELQRKYPGTAAAKVDLAGMRADTIVGWYDKGNNFHEQKMEKNLGHDFGGLKVIQPVLRGTAVK
jgi:hypothetical protein